MPEPTSIVAMIAAIKHSFDVIKAVKEADYDLDKSILKEKIAVLVDSLLEAKIQASETLDVIQEKDKRIAELENALELKPKLIRFKSAYYEMDENSNPFGDSYCSHCWEINHKAVHLHEPTHKNKSRICPLCKNEYDRYASYPIEAKEDLE